MYYDNLVPRWIELMDRWRRYLQPISNYLAQAKRTIMIATSSKFIIQDDIITLYVVQYITYTINKECH